MIPPDIAKTMREALEGYKRVVKLATKVSPAKQYIIDQSLARIDAALAHLDTLPAAPAPDWSKAPSWAMWWAVDANGDAFWYSHKPEANTRDWRSAHQCIRTTMPCPNWRETLTARPTEDK